jgi:hypothetical protein
MDVGFHAGLARVIAVFGVKGLMPTFGIFTKISLLPVVRAVFSDLRTAVKRTL